MTSRLDLFGPAFKRAMIVSGIVHAVLLAVLVVNPRLPQPSRKGALHYVTLNLGGGESGGRGGSGGAGGAKLAATPIAPGTLRDLTTAAKLKAEEPNRMRFPTDKPKREPKAKPDKKAAVTKPAPGAKPAETPPAGGATGAAGAEGGGQGLTIGVGGAGGVGGEGFGFGGELGLSDFPYAYYLVAVRDKISANWVPSIADLGGGGTLRTVVYFRIFRNGSISTVDVRESSGLQAFDLNARRAVANSAPFPPLPPDYDSEHLGIFLAFENIR